MRCNKSTSNCTNCDFNVKTVGVCDVSRVTINGANRADLNWTEISLPEILYVPCLKPDIENVDQVYAQAVITTTKLIETPFAYRSYNLYFLPAALLTEITTIVNAISLTALNTAVTAVTGVLDDIAGVPGLPATIVTALTTLSTGLTNATTAVTTALTTLTDLLAIDNPPANLVCTALAALIDALEALITLLGTVVNVVNGILEAVSPALAALIEAILDALPAGGLQGLVNTAVAAAQAILTPLLGIDCDPGSAFQLIGNAEGTCLSGRKLIIEGTLKQKIVYTGEVTTQSVHSAHYESPFIAFIIPYAKFEGLTYTTGIVVYDPVTNGPITINGYIYDPAVGINVDLCEEFSIDKCIEDIYVYPLSKRSIFKNITLFLKARPNVACS